jgi:hypothetical protein
VPAVVNKNETKNISSRKNRSGRLVCKLLLSRALGACRYYLNAEKVKKVERTMKRQSQKSRVLRVLLLLLLLTSACSSQQKHSEDDFMMGTDDPFKDPFFSSSQEWDSSVLKQSEVLSQDVPKDVEEPTTWVEKSEALLMGTIIVGGGVAKMLFLPMLGL